MTVPAIAEREETTVYTLNGVTYLPDYRKPMRFVAPGYHEVHRPTIYTAEDLVFFGAKKEQMLLWRRPRLASDARI